MGRTAKLTISLPEELVAFADEIARKRKTSRSKVISACLRQAAEGNRVAEMAEGYRAMAGEQNNFAAIASEIEHEVIPEWHNP
jgi:metal-responsive CopG/Arc/MetJ family transcriptional regulator